MPTRRTLRRKAANIKESVAGTVGEAVDAARDVASRARSGADGDPFDDNLGPDRGTQDQLEARIERAQQDVRGEALQEAREEAMDELKEEYRDHLQERKRLEMISEGREHLDRNERELDRLRERAAAAEGRREARQETREERAQRIRQEEKEREMRRLEPRERADVVEAEPMGQPGGFGQRPLGATGPETEFGYGAEFGAPGPAFDDRGAEFEPAYDPVWDEGTSVAAAAGPNPALTTGPVFDSTAQVDEPHGGVFVGPEFADGAGGPVPVGPEFAEGDRDGQREPVAIDVTGGGIW